MSWLRSWQRAKSVKQESSWVGPLYGPGGISPLPATDMNLIIQWITKESFKDDIRNTRPGLLPAARHRSGTVSACQLSNCATDVKQVHINLNGYAV